METGKLSTMKHPMAVLDIVSQYQNDRPLNQREKIELVMAQYPALTTAQNAYGRFSFGGPRTFSNNLGSYLQRAAFIAKNGMRNYDAVGGYPLTSPIILESLYRFGDIAKRIAEIKPQFTWDPEIIISDKPEKDDDEKDATGFEEDIAEIFRDLRVIEKFERADLCLAWSSFCVISFGLRDGLELTEEAGMVDGPEDVLYMSVFDERNAGLQKWGNDKSLPTYDRPTEFNLRTGGTDRTAARSDGFGGSFKPTRTWQIHHSRGIVVAEGLTNNDDYGQPRLDAGAKALWDLMKMRVGMAESTYQRGRNPTVVSIDDNSVEGEAEIARIDEYFSKMHEQEWSSALVLRNGSVQNVSTPPVDISKNVEKLMEIVAGTYGIPVAMLRGNEISVRSGDMDQNQFMIMIRKRRAWAEATFLRPFIDRMIEVGAVREPEDGTYEIQWPPLAEATEKEISSNANLKMNAVNSYMKANPGARFPLTEQQVVEDVLKMEYRKQELDEIEEEKKQEQEENDDNSTQPPGFPDGPGPDQGPEGNGEGEESEEGDEKDKPEEENGNQSGKQ